MKKFLETPDSITSDGLTTFIEKELGGKHHRFKRGYKNVINESIRLNSIGEESHLAIETSGHAAIKENYFLDDGAYLITKVLIKMGKLKIEKNQNIIDLISNLKQPLEDTEIRVKILEEDFKEYGNKIIEDLKNFTQNEKNWSLVEKNFEGVRVNCDKNSGDGWFLLRLSLHDPVIPINIESNIQGGVEIIKDKLFKFLESYKSLEM